MNKKEIVIKILKLQIEWDPVPGEGKVLLGRSQEDNSSIESIELEYLDLNKAIEKVNNSEFEIVDILPGNRPVIKIVK